MIGEPLKCEAVSSDKNPILSLPRAHSDISSAGWAGPISNPQWLMKPIPLPLQLLALPRGEMEQFAEKDRVRSSYFPGHLQLGWISTLLSAGWFMLIID